MKKFSIELVEHKIATTADGRVYDYSKGYMTQDALKARAVLADRFTKKQIPDYEGGLEGVEKITEEEAHAFAEQAISDAKVPSVLYEIFSAMRGLAFDAHHEREISDSDRRARSRGILSAAESLMSGLRLLDGKDYDALCYYSSYIWGAEVLEGCAR
ncbi:MAG: hypothetical protein LBT21_06205 [Oscillospiraceae bacterium]|jgi:hypothetical protein|nr:hypothetical protein [Oscillospiraceae bacterium]